MVRHSNSTTALVVCAMVATIVGPDVAVLRHHALLRLAVNAGVVACFGVGYAVLAKR